MRSLQLHRPKSRTNIVVIGGGTGSFTVLSGLKKHARNITALVNMVDDGGSTGILRDELGALPPGDVRQCLVALSSSPKVRELFNYRFEDGSFKGHPFGNLFLSALEQMTGSFAEAVETAGEVLNITGTVLPITLEDIHLVLQTPKGGEVFGQRRIEDSGIIGELDRPQIRLEPTASINPDARTAILQAELVVIAPGDIYTSVGPALLVDGVAEALDQCGAKVVYVTNLMTKHGQTDGFIANDFVNELERIAGIRFIDYVIYNDRLPSASMREHYAGAGEQPVGIDAEAFLREGRTLIQADVLADTVWKEGQRSDPLALKRSYIRHDQEKTAHYIMGVLHA